MHFGFSFLGFLFLLMLLIPNVLWTKNKPQDYEKYVERENRILAGLEKIGQVSVTCISLFFYSVPEDTGFGWSFLLLAGCFLMVFYEIYWIRYFRSSKTMQDFYSSFLGIPVAGATLPVLAFLLLGIYGKNILLIGAVLLLGAGHIGIHSMHRRELSAASAKETGEDCQSTEKGV